MKEETLRNAAELLNALEMMLNAMKFSALPAIELILKGMRENLDKMTEGTGAGGRTDAQ